jgi:hypothetical protein
MIRKDIPFFQIVEFQKFDRGEEVSQHIEGEHDLNPGDILEWEAGQNLSGLARVIKAQPGRNGWTYVTLKKQS